MTTINHPLKTPVKIGDKTITSVTLRRPNGKDVRGVGNVKNLENTDFLVRLIANLGQLTLDEADAIDGADMFELFEVVTGFFETAPAAPKASTI